MLSWTGREGGSEEVNRKKLLSKAAMEERRVGFHLCNFDLYMLRCIALILLVFSSLLLMLD